MSFFCCNSEDPEFKYEVNTLTENGQGHSLVTKYYNSPEEINQSLRQSQNVSITKVRTQTGFSELQTQIKKNKQKYTDNTFPP